MGEEPPKEKQEDKKIVHTYPLVRFSEMGEESKAEIIETVVTACEKFAANNELAAKMIKEDIDKKLGPPFHVVVGEGYGFEISYEIKNILYMYFGGNVAVLIWKC